MPRNQKYKNIKRGRKRRVPRRKRRMVKRVPRGPFPVSRIAKMKLTTGLQILTCTSGNLASLNVYANWPVYGVRFAYGWDQWSILYNRAVVLGSRITTYFQNNLADTSQILGMGGIYVSDDSTNYTDYQDLSEANKGKFARVNTGGTAYQPKVKNWFSAKKFFNVKDVRDNIALLGNGIGASVPANDAMYKVWAQPLDKATSATYTCTSIIEYIVLFSEPKDVPSS